MQRIMTGDNSLYRQMLLIRLVEEKLIELYPSDKIQSPVHLSIGQEAVAVGACAPLRPDDLVWCTYRSHAFYIAKGGDLREMFAELYGRATGMAKGKAGSMHLTAPDVGLMGSSAVVASTIPHAAGAAMAAKLRGLDQVSLCVFGDGATEEGVYHETLNFASKRQLPVVFLCENNGLAVHTDMATRQSYDILTHARAYGYDPVEVTDGHDPNAVADAMGTLYERARTTKAPQIALVHTYRYKEHVGPGDDFDAGYRDRSELEKWQAKDVLINNPELVAAMTPEIEAAIADAVQFAESSPEPGWDDLMSDVI